MYVYLLCGIREILSCGIRNPGLWNPQVQLKESIIPLTIGIRNPDSIDNTAGIQNRESKTFLDYPTRGEIII